MGLTNDKSQLLPSDEDLKFYQEHGWYISQKIISDEEIEEALKGCQKIHSGVRDYQLPVQLPIQINWTPEQNLDSFRCNDFIIQQSIEIRKLALNPLIGRIASYLSSSDQIRLFISSLLYKPPGEFDDSVKVGWHNDRAYWKTCTSLNMLTAWIPLHDCNDSMGTIMMIDGSHKWSNNPTLLELRQEKNFSTTKMESLERRLEATGFSIKKIPMNLKKGQVSFHHCLTFHGSYPNQSHLPRISVVLHLQDKSNKYQIAKNKNGKIFVNNLDELCRKLPDGIPDYSDPLFCPVLWEKK